MLAPQNGEAEVTTEESHSEVLRRNMEARAEIAKLKSAGRTRKEIMEQLGLTEERYHILAYFKPGRKHNKHPVVVGASPSNPGEPCKCPDCGKDCKSGWGMHLHRTRVHGAPTRIPRKTAAIVVRQREQPAEVAAIAEVSFCPVCCTNVKAVAVAIDFLKSGRAVSFCPVCGTNMRAVAISLTMEKRRNGGRQ